MVGEKLFLASGLGKGTKYELNRKSNRTSDISSNGASDISSSVTSSKTNIRTEKLHKAILEFCSGEFKSLVEIAERVGRSVRHLKRGPIPTLMQSGRLVRKYPDVPNHPEQQYKSVKGNEN